MRSLPRVQDTVLLALFMAMAFAGPKHAPGATVLILMLAGLQVAEPHVEFFLTVRGSIVSNLLKLLLAYPLVMTTGGISSSYYLMFLLPVISAATTIGVAGTLLFTGLSCASYLSALLTIDWDRYTIPPPEILELALRVTFLAVFGFLTQRLAEANRLEARKAQAVAEQLAEANRNLQEAEAAVRRSERLAALGQLSGGLAHELRNPLGTIKASSEMLLKQIPADNPVAAELAGFISSEVDRTNSLVTRFLEFARPLELRREPHELVELLDRAIRQVERGLPEGRITIYRNYSPDVPLFPFDAELLERVFYNLILNAAQASPQGGTVTVKTRLLDGRVEVCIIDRGCGIDPKHLESIFNPFFTTKKEGVGLGLSIVSKIVDLHGGKMTVESEPGKGSIFRVYLPR